MKGTGAATDRRLDLDWIRILAVLLLIPFHSARVFDVFEDFYVKNAELSAPISDVVIRLIGAWQMSLLFLVAGASTWYALRFRGSGQYLGERLKRLLVPFVVGTLVIVPPQMYVALLHRQRPAGSYLAYYPGFFEIRPDGMADYTGVGFSWGHLWFILDLFVISVLALPILLWLRSTGGRRFLDWLARLVQRRWTLWLLFLPLPIVSELPRVDSKPFFLYLFLFIVGFMLMSDPRFGETLRRQGWAALAVVAVTMSIMYAVVLTGTQFEDDSLGDVLLWLVRGLNLWCWLVAILGLGQRYLNVDGRVLRYARDGAYPFYVLHQTVIVVLAYYIVQWGVPALPKFLVLVAGSFVVTVALYELVVRRTNAIRFLFGMKPLPRADSGTATAPAERQAAQPR